MSFTILQKKESKDAIAIGMFKNVIQNWRYYCSLLHAYKNLDMSHYNSLSMIHNGLPTSFQIFS